MAPGEAAHLLEPLDRHEGRERLALALDDELVVSEGDAIEHVAEPLANVDGGYLFRHDEPPQLLWLQVMPVASARGVASVRDAGDASHNRAESGKSV